MRVRVLVAALVAVLIVASAGVASFAYSTGQTAAQHSAALRELESVRQRNNAVYASLTDPALQAEFQNASSLQQARAALGDYRARTGGAIKGIEAKLAELHQERDRLRAASRDPLLFTGRGQLDHDLARIEAVTDAFENAKKFLTIGDGNANVLNAILAAVLEIGNIAGFANSGNFSQAAALVPEMKQQLQSTATAAQGLDAVPPLRALIDALSHFATDFDQALAARLANDDATLARLATALRADEDAVSSAFDMKAISAAVQKQLDPYRARYADQMRKAGFTVTGV